MSSASRRNSLPPLSAAGVVQVKRPYSVSGADGQRRYQSGGKKGNQCILRMIKTYYMHLLWTFIPLKSMMRKKCVLYASSFPVADCFPGGEVPLFFFAGTAFSGHTVHGINLCI